MIYRNGELAREMGIEKASTSTAILTDAKLNKDITNLIKSEAEAQATLEMVRSVLACDHYSVKEQAKIEILKSMLWVGGDAE